MIFEAEIKIYGLAEYLGLYRYEEGKKPSVTLRFRPERLERIKKLDDLAKIQIGLNTLRVEEFKKKYLDNGAKLELDPKDSKPRNWSILRRY